MKVLLISANTEQMNMPVLPLGMACVAAAAQNAGHDVKIVNLMAQQDSRALLEDAVKTFGPQVIGISVRNIDDQVMIPPNFLLEPVKKLVAECQSLSDAPIILGGAGYSIFPKSALAYLGADMGIQGEGESAFVMLLEQLENKADISNIPGLWLPGTGLQKKACFLKNLDAYPLPLPNIHLSLPPAWQNEEIWIPFQTRRGCAMDCSYCSTATIEGRVLRKYSVERASKAISRYAEAGFEHLFFVDNTFNFPRSYAKALCDHIIAAGLNIIWRCILYPAGVDDELVEKMARAGCCEVSLGFESGSEKMLGNFNKKFGPEDVRRISKMLRTQGIRQMGFLLLNGPGETRETVEESLAFADSLDLESMKVTMGVRIYPYTPLSRIAIREGLIASEEELLFPKFYMTRGLDRDWLRKTVTTWMNERPHWIS